MQDSTLSEKKNGSNSWETGQQSSIIFNTSVYSIAREKERQGKTRVRVGMMTCILKGPIILGSTGSNII